jgi:hypothetical protein
MAHRGEAQEFLRSLDLAPTDSRFYLGAETSLLITGEGPFEVMSLLPFYIAKYEIKEILNYGIAGSLNKELEVGAIYPIRTAYAYGLDKPRFQSFTADPNNLTSKLDCITTEQRVLTDAYAQTLDSFAQIVDRELWAIGKVANTYKIPFKSFKLISDLAGETTKCFDLKQMAEQYSKELFEFHQNNEVHFVEHKHTALDLDLPFKASFTQTKRIENLYNKLNDSFEMNELIEEAITKSELASQNIHSKAMANNFISFLENKINPINTAIESQLKKILSPIEMIGANIQYDRKLENKKITLKMDINDQVNIDKLIQGLSEFKYSDIENIWNGKIDV